MSGNDDKSLFDYFHMAVIGGIALLVFTKIKTILLLLFLFIVGYTIWDLSCTSYSSAKLSEDGYFRGIKSKSLSITPIPDVDNLEKVTFQFNGYDLHVYKVVAEWLRDGGLVDPQTELGYLEGKRCKQGLSASCEAAWTYEELFP